MSKEREWSQKFGSTELDYQRKILDLEAKAKARAVEAEDLASKITQLQKALKRVPLLEEGLQREQENAIALAKEFYEFQKGSQV